MARLEYNIEQAIRGALVTACAAIDGVVLRCWLGDDSPTVAQEEVSYPYVMVKASPSVPEGYKALHKATPVEVKCATHYDGVNGPKKDSDKKRAILLALYTAVRDTLDADTFAITGASKQSTMITGGESGEDGAEQYMTINLSVLSCG